MDAPIQQRINERITFAEARRRGIVPGNPDLVTLWRWSLKGVRGVRLRTERWGRKLFTTEAWLREFAEALSARDAAAPPLPPPSPSRRQGSRSTSRREREIAAAESRLAATGFAT